MVHRDVTNYSTGGGVNGDGGSVEMEGGLLTKFSRKLMGSSGSNTNAINSSSGEDVYVRGPKPIFTARLLNVAPFTSTALTSRVYGGGHGCTDDDSKKNFEEELNLAIHLHQDGVARLRITEVLLDDNNKGSNNSNVRSMKTPRCTLHELVLNENEMIGIQTQNFRGMSTNPVIHAKLSSSSLNTNKNEEEEEEEGRTDDKISSPKEIETMVSSLVQRANINVDNNHDPNKRLDNYIVLSYSTPNVGSWQLLLQLEPFQVYFFRGVPTTNNEPPIIVAGTGGLTHFEVRRSKECSSSSAGSDSDVVSDKRKLTEFDVDLEDEKEEVDEDDRHGGKEIVGYWEDGLAIYADGTREEKRELEEDTGTSTTKVQGEEDESDEEFDVDKGEGRAQRRLDEEEYDTDGMWEEKFGDHLDSKPYGPMSVGMELTFPASNHLFGLPEHASSTQLKTTAGSDGHHYYKEPYRLYNLDVFEYELDETMALYGHIPLVVSQSMSTGTAGAFWFNPTETFVDVEETPEVGNVDSASKTHFMSESGIIDLFLLPGPDPATMYGQYARLTGRLALPPMFSLGYHQCRWNYRDEADVYHVHSKFEELDYPYDVLWLDIEHTDGKRYFTWDDKLFPHPEEMQKKLGGDGRRMVTIIDPHIKRDNNYYIHKEATALGLYIKDKKFEKDYDGWCWPGSSSYLDFTTEKVRSWWAEQFQFSKYKGSTPELFTWNDMNEPSVFNGPEVSMQKDLLNLNKCEHREWHK